MAKYRKRIEQRLQAQKQRKRQKQKARQKEVRPMPASSRAGAIAIAEQCVAHDDWEGAQEVLEQADRRNPGRRDVQRLLLDVYHELGQYLEYCEVCRHLLELDPDNPPLHLMYAAGLMSAFRPASALRAFERFVTRWPNDPFAAGASEEIAHLKEGLEELVAEWPFPPEERLELAARNEELLAALQTAPRKAIAVAEAILRRWPSFVPARNNLSEAHFLNGDLGRAMEASRQVLEVEPNNVHARCNLARHLFLAGQFAEARQFSARLWELKLTGFEGYCKLAEVFALEGQDDAVLEVFRRSEAACDFDAEAPYNVALLHHLAAVAAARQGHERQAHRYWKRALQSDPEFDLAADNLADLSLPVSRRQGPWPYTIAQWLPEPAMERLAKQVDRLSRGKKGAISEAQRQKLSAEFQSVVRLIPHLLDRGDENGREFALQIARFLNLPETNTALRDFCRGQRGTDEMRMEALSYLQEAGAASEGPQRLWLKGEWHEIEAFATEITPEATSDYGHSPRVNDLSYEAMQALHRGDGATAERLLHEALELEPDKPDLVNNLAMALQQQGNITEAIRLIKEVHQRWPDYFFGCIAMANLKSDDGQFEKAQELLGSFSKRRKMHITEFSALCMSYIQLELRQGHYHEAQEWLDRWKNVDPEHPQLPRFQELVAGDGLVRRLGGLLRRGLKRGNR